MLGDRSKSSGFFSKPYKGSSRMWQKLQVRFQGELQLVTAVAYPALIAVLIGAIIP